MAPTSKPTSISSSKSTANANPAPDFTVNMNRIQTQFEAHLKAVRAFLPSRSDLNNNNSTAANSTGKSFSALISGANSTGSQSQSRDATAAAAAAARRAAQEAEFAEERALDPNVGLGHARAPAGSKNGNDGGKDPETARLRGRLLGKRGRGVGRDGDGLQKWVRKEESSDEEPGRSGLGRAKKNGKRPRAEMEADNGAKQESGVRVEADAPPEAKASATEYTQDSVDETDGPKQAAENLASKPTVGNELNEPAAEGHPKKRKKKKRKPKDKTDGD
ncbi:hypothetical protein F5Y13DRAFT_173179 [Hypoxylon sp. FL1857]|nr:hypothetical protein F5Y13DRAFT_173179 [Hypoxylon sp. FL1857]